MRALSLMVEGKVVDEALASDSFLLVRYVDGMSHTIDWRDEKGERIDGRPSLGSEGHLIIVGKANTTHRREFGGGHGSITRAIRGRMLRDVRLYRYGIDLTFMDGGTQRINWLTPDGRLANGKPSMKYEGWHILAKPPKHIDAIYRPRGS